MQNIRSGKMSSEVWLFLSILQAREWTHTHTRYKDQMRQAFFTQFLRDTTQSCKWLAITLTHWRSTLTWQCDLCTVPSFHWRGIDLLSNRIAAGQVKRTNKSKEKTGETSSRHDLDTTSTFTTWPSFPSLRPYTACPKPGQNNPGSFIRYHSNQGGQPVHISVCPLMPLDNHYHCCGQNRVEFLRNMIMKEEFAKYWNKCFLTMDKMMLAKQWVFVIKYGTFERCLNCKWIVRQFCICIMCTQMP